jgi:L-ascorbate metabolism protein UlaG (beta-lactamase superfamily)
MKVRWLGHSAFVLSDGDGRVVLDPWGDTESFKARGIQFDYPPIEGLEADLLLISHEHLDHNGAEAVVSDPQVIRSVAGTFESKLGEVTAIASEHDYVAGTKRGQNTIFALQLGDARVCHMGDFGQAGLRAAQAEAIGRPDVLLIPVGGGPTIGAQEAAEIVRRLAPRIAVPMHYATANIGFVEPVDGFLEAAADLDVVRLESPEFELEDLAPPAGDTRIVVPAPPD